MAALDGDTLWFRPSLFGGAYDASISFPFAGVITSFIKIYLEPGAVLEAAAAGPFLFGVGSNFNLTIDGHGTLLGNGVPIVHTNPDYTGELVIQADHYADSASSVPSPAAKIKTRKLGPKFPSRAAKPRQNVGQPAPLYLFDFNGGGIIHINGIDCYSVTQPILSTVVSDLTTSVFYHVTDSANNSVLDAFSIGGANTNFFFDVDRIFGALNAGVSGIKMTGGSTTVLNINSIEVFDSCITNVGSFVEGRIETLTDFTSFGLNLSNNPAGPSGNGFVSDLHLGSIFSSTGGSVGMSFGPFFNALNQITIDLGQIYMPVNPETSAETIGILFGQDVTSGNVSRTTLNIKGNYLAAVIPITNTSPPFTTLSFANGEQDNFDFELCDTLSNSQGRTRAVRVFDGGDVSSPLANINFRGKYRTGGDSGFRY